MWPYIATASLIGCAALFSGSRRPNTVAWLLTFILLVAFVGLRHKVGMDWNNYLRMIAKAANAPTFVDLFQVCEPLYAAMLSAGHASGFGMYAVNLLGAAIFLFGAFQFARRTPEPWLALLAAFPYCIVVIGMSANRQAVAAGVIMWIVSRADTMSFAKKTFWIIIASGFHVSALLCLVFVGLEMRVRAPVKLAAVAAMTALAIYLLQSTGQSVNYDSSYGSGQTELTQSSGAAYQVALTAIPAGLLLILNRYQPGFFPFSLVYYMSIAAVATSALVPFSSTAASRISVYWFPVSMLFWASLPALFKTSSRPLVRAAIIATSLLILAGWLSYANTSFAYIPYANAVFRQTWELHIDL